MNKSIFTLALSLMAVSAAYAAPTMPLGTLDGFELGAQISSYKYQETLNGSEFMNNQGDKTGIVGSYTKNLGDRWYISTDLSYVRGSVDYTGNGTLNDVAESYTDLRVVSGHDFQMKGYTLTPFAGIGARILSNGQHGTTSTGAITYSRDSTYQYVPVGLTHRFGAVGGRIATTVEYDHLISGKQTSHLTEAGADGDVVNNQTSGKGLRIGLAFETQQMTIGVFYKYWNIDRSDDQTFTYRGMRMTGFEPDNTSKEVGIQLKYRF